jgi:hypothetical protein
MTIAMVLAACEELVRLMDLAQGERIPVGLQRALEEHCR